MLAAIYARQSVEKIDSVSIDAQVESCVAICRTRGWQTEVYIDTGYSGKNMERPAFRRLLTDLQSGLLGAVVSYKLDRISRSIVDFAQLLTLFDKKNVQYISSTEQFDTSSPAGRAMIYIIMVFAQLERETITQRVSDNYRYRASMGLYMGGGIPYGYQARHILNDGKKAAILEVDAKQSETVKHIYSLYLEGLNSHEIARILSNDGILSPQGKAFIGSAVIRVLRNMTYCSASPELYRYLTQAGYHLLSDLPQFTGEYGMCCTLKSKQGKKTQETAQQIVVGRHEPLISAADWILVQKMLSGKKQAAKHTRPAARCWLAGLIRCGECGGSFGLKSTKGKYAYYFCRGRASNEACCCKNDLWLPAGDFESAIQKCLIGHVKELIAKSDLFKSGALTENEEISKQKQKLYEYRSEIDRLIQNIGMGETLDGYLRNRIESLDESCRRLAKSISESEKCAYHQSSLAKYAEYVMPAISSAGCDMKRRLARAVIDRITVSSDGRTVIYYKA